LYGMATWLAVKRLSRASFVVAVYLRRGAAKGELLPGISDIDLLAVTDGASQEQVLDLRKAYRSLQLLLPVLDRDLQAWDRQLLESRFGITRYKYRLAEGLATWRL